MTGKYQTFGNYSAEERFFGNTTPFELQERYGTPLYVYSEAILRRRCKEILSLVDRDRFVASYSVKANGNLELLKIARDEGMHADAMSPGEIHVELLAGFQPGEIFYICNNVSSEEMRYAVDKGVMISVDSLSQLRRLGEITLRGEVAVRFNPGLGAGHHEKVVTGGKRTKWLWLADTACTQALWQAVTGQNPSRFKGEGLPVDQVSWEQCRDVFDQVNREMPLLNLRFPTEAEWEYSCRAGTITPFWFGEGINTDQVNFNGNHPYAGGEKGQYREETVAVKSLPSNGWGLFEMHGNLGEWCEDRFGEYPTDRVDNPQGPDHGDSRVLRGGAWINGGWKCRSAVRGGSLPGNSYDFFGFRLARDQAEQE